MKNILILIVLFLASNAFGQAVPLKTKTFSAKFKIKNAGIGVDGYFKNGTATILYDEKNPQNSKFIGKVIVKSISTGIELRDKHITEKTEYFDAAKFAEIKMESTNVKLENNSLLITWNISMKGITKSITVPAVAVANKDGSISFSTNFMINRRDWNVGGKSLMMADKLNVILSVIATK